MKMIIAFAALVAVAIAAPGNPDIVVVNETPVDNIGVGGYRYGYALSNGAVKEETAQFVDAGPEGPAPEVSGSFGWVDPLTNIQYLTKYTAGKDGYKAEGAHLPA